MTFLWSLRREVWENRSLIVAPLIVTAVVFFATMMGIAGTQKEVRDAEPARQGAVLAKPYRMAPAPVMLASFIVGLFYAIDSLYGERRDRSILFWKSMPVSDRTTVLAKAAVPLALLPLFAFVLAATTQLALAIVTTPILLAYGNSPLMLWRELAIFEGVPVMLYGLFVHTLWFAPIYAWAILVSAWARRVPLLWATLPILAIGAVEHVGFNGNAVVSLMKYRLGGAMQEGFANMGRARGFDEISPLRFFTAPGLWLGLLFAAMCIAFAIGVRRRREAVAGY